MDPPQEVSSKFGDPFHKSIRSCLNTVSSKSQVIPQGSSHWPLVVVSGQCTLVRALICWSQLHSDMPPIHKHRQALLSIAIVVVICCQTVLTSPLDVEEKKGKSKNYKCLSKALTFDSVKVITEICP